MKKRKWETFLKAPRFSLRPRGVLTGPRGAPAQAPCHAGDSAVAGQGRAGPSSRPVTAAGPGGGHDARAGASWVLCWWHFLTAPPLWLVLPQKVRSRQGHPQETRARPQERRGGRGPCPPESTQAPAPSAWLLSTASVTGLTTGASSTGPQGTVTAVLHTARPLVTPATTPRGAGRCSDPCRAPHVSDRRQGFRARAPPAGHFLSSGASVWWVTGNPACGREARGP